MPAATSAAFTGIHNENEFYSHHYLSEIFSGDIRATVDRWREQADAESGRTPYAALRSPGQRLRAVLPRLLPALGYEWNPANHPLDDGDEVPVAASWWPKTSLELEAMLNAPLERWRVFLHPSQRRLVERDWKGPARGLGAAGTGKTVVAMHRARWLARNLPGRGRILFTTFTRNLAADLDHDLGATCKPEELARIDVTNPDRWVVRFLRGRRYQFRILFGRDHDAWQRALDLKSPDMDCPHGFYDDEWEQVVRAHGVTSLDEYLRVSRVDRGSRLNRAARARTCRVFEEYRTQFAERGLKEVDDAYRDATVLLQNDPEALDYAAVIVDAGRGTGAQAYRLLHAIVPATEETRRWAARLLAGRAIDDLDGGSDDDKGITSLSRGPEPLLKHFDSREDQSAFIVAYLKQVQAEDST